MGDFVILHHTLPDGSSHYDWLFTSNFDIGSGATASAQGDPDERCLTAFRSHLRPDEITPGGSRALVEKLPKHRRLYLTHEGPLPPPHPSQAYPDGAQARDRGFIQRVMWGEDSCVKYSLWDGFKDGAASGGIFLERDLTIRGGAEGVEVGRRIRLICSSVFSPSLSCDQWYFRVDGPDSGA